MLKTVAGLVLVFTLYHHFQAGWAADWCYNCSTSIDPTCGDPFHNTTQQQCTSSTDKFNCVKYTHTIGDRIITFRGCRSARDTCSDIIDALTAENTNVLTCSLCSTNLCNSAATMQVSLLFSFASFILFLLNR